MEKIDFSALERNRTQNKAPTSDDSIKQSDYTSKDKTALKTANKDDTDGFTPLQLEVNRRKAEYEKALEVYKEYQQNKKTIAKQRTALFKGLQNSHDLTDLMAIALECIELTTHEKGFKARAEAELKKNY